MWRDSYPHDADSRTKEIPSHVKMDLSPPNPLYQPWSYGGNYCYPFPQEYHGCCNHGYYGGGPYSFRPNYTHYPPPLAFHNHGFYPPYPGAYPGYSVPPPHYSVEQPRYDYDKNNHAPHGCCGCNHREDEKKLRTEEEPKVDKKTSESCVPFLLKDCPNYPIMWVPPGYMNNTEPMVHQSQQDGGDGNRFPFQIFWLPCKNDQVGKDGKENNLDPVAHNGFPDKKMRENNEGSGSKAECETSSVQKVIPVKQVGTNEEKQNPENIHMKVESGSVVDKKTDNGSREGKASPKTSKLPPVCLRIDPLPRKKKSSRSPSPPGDKHRSNGFPVNSSQQQTQFNEGLKISKEEQSKDIIKTVEVGNDVTKVEKDYLSGDVLEEEGKDGETGMVHAKGEPCEGQKKNLSEHEAARIIQSVYRGFEVRKSHPLMKLRQIGEVGKQVLELRNRIKDLELSSSIISIDGKQKLVIGETIMSLLLKLDTIQGLHPIVRDIRKSVAKDLVGLQEKLDSLTSVKSEAPSATSITEHVMHPEDDPMREKSGEGQSQSSLHKNHEHQVTESQYDDDDAEACNTNVEPQLEFHIKENVKDDGIHEKVHQAPTQLDSANQIVGLDMVTPENREMKATESQDDGGAGAFSTNGEKQFESHNEKSIYDKMDEVVGLDTSIFGNHEVEAINFMDDGNVEAHDFKNHEQLVEQNNGEPNSNQLQIPVEAEQTANCVVQDLVQAESDVSNAEKMLSDVNYKVETAVPPQNDRGCDVILEPRVVEPEQEKSHHTPAVFGSVDSRDDATAQTYDSDVSMVEMKSELPKAGAENVHAEEAPKGGEVEDDVGGAPPAGSDGKLMEENEKLRVMVEELMKAGNEQLEVIKELTGRVKDLEKKLSRKKKMKANKCKSRGCVVKEEIRDCLV